MKQLVKNGLAHVGLQLTRLPRSSADDANALVPVPVGKFEILIRKTSPLSWAYRTNPEYGSVLGRLVLQMLKKYPSLHGIDVGANFGDSVAIIKSVADVPVLSIEGDPHCFPILQQNLQQFHTVVAQNLFLGEKTEMISAVLDKQGWNATIIPDSGDTDGTNPMKITRLDDLLGTDSNRHLYKVLKVDAEGFDCRIIRGSKDFIAEVKPTILFEYNRENMNKIGENGLETLWMLADIGYRHVLVYDPQGRFVLATELTNTELIESLHYYADGENGNIYYYDLCFFHADDQVSALAFAKTERHRIETR